MKHDDNAKKIEAFMQENNMHAYNREEVALKNDVSKGATRSVLRELHREGKLEKHPVKERNGEVRVYYNWRRCEHLAVSRCVNREQKCRGGDDCCIYCRMRKDCIVGVCKTAIKYVGD